MVGTILQDMILPDMIPRDTIPRDTILMEVDHGEAVCDDVILVRIEVGLFLLWGLLV